MAKKKIIRKYKPNLFEGGGGISNIRPAGSGVGISSNYNASMGNSGSSGGSSPGIGGYAQAAQAATGLFQNALELGKGVSDEDMEMYKSNTENYTSGGLNTISGINTNDDLMNIYGSMNRLGSVDIKSPSFMEAFLGNAQAATSGASAGASFGPWGAAIGGIVGGVSDIVGRIFGNKNRKKKEAEINEGINRANALMDRAFSDKATAVDTQNDLARMANFAAYGGLFDIGGAIDYELNNRMLDNKEREILTKQRITSLPNSFQSPDELQGINTFARGGGIHIKPENKGKFTSYCGGKVTSECIERGKHSNNPLTRKRATFAANARNWHGFGGWLNTQGGDFTNGVTFFDEGNSHEENPNMGIHVSNDSQGNPNLVEEGEVMFEDYVFSNRMNIPKNIKKRYKLKGKTFADAAKYIQKESEERPNDPISKQSLQANMQRLMQSQENLRQEEEMNNNTPNLFYKGGPTGDVSLIDETWTQEDVEAFLRGLSTPQESASGDGIIENEVSNYVAPNEKQTWTRYAPIIGSGMAGIVDSFTPIDYSNADLINNVGVSTPSVSFSPIGNYLRYNPLDRDFYINKLNQQASATRRGLMNTSGGNRLTAQAGIIAADYNYGQNLGNLARQAEEYNQAQRERVEGFNRGTNMFNTESGLKASSLNAELANEANRMRLTKAQSIAQLREGIKNQAEARRSANITNFLQGLGDMGWENEQKNWLNRLAEAGVLKLDTEGNYTGRTKQSTKKKGGSNG